MIEIKTIGVWGFEGSLRGCRMPFESFDKSDSGECLENCSNCIYGSEEIYDENAGELSGESWWSCSAFNELHIMPFSFGRDDMALCKKLIRSGSEHRKFLRMIHVQAEIRAPRYFTQELATYKIGTAMNSSSTMHLITKRELTENDICHDGMSQTRIESILHEINMAIRAYNNEADKLLKEMTFREIKQMLPEGFMQSFIWDADYEVLLSIYSQRKGHRLSEWKQFRDWIEKLPYMEEFLECVQ